MVFQIKPFPRLIRCRKTPYQNESLLAHKACGGNAVPLTNIYLLTAAWSEHYVSRLTSFQLSFTK
jgi:hypothetical protein